ncbi:MAG TPA: FAD binding domain-containing protein [Spirochaetales bacterium]|nr:FAD binding domain-containing protein [Spirochaetales bacterium]HPM73828.1 FAD binding domain-containing protein [Spirochaetales bacterium]
MRVDDVSAPQTIAEAVAVLKRQPGALPWAGGTLILTSRGSDGAPVSVLDLGRIPELRAVSRSDRYLELGACVRLATIQALPGSLALQPLRDAIGLVGTATVRNLATLGGNVASRDSFMTCFPSLACMDATVELRDASGSRWTGIHSLVDGSGRPAFPAATLLTRIRIPTAPWDAFALHRLGEPTKGDAFASTFAAAARFEKETISELRLIASGRTLARDRALELSLIGKRLPLTVKDVEEAQEAAREQAIEAGFPARLAERFGAYVMSFLANVQEGGR